MDQDHRRYDEREYDEHCGQPAPSGFQCLHCPISTLSRGDLDLAATIGAIHTRSSSSCSRLAANVYAAQAVERGNAAEQHDHANDSQSDDNLSCDHPRSVRLSRNHVVLGMVCLVN